MFSERSTGSASALARTRTANSFGRAPAATRPAISAGDPVGLFRARGEGEVADGPLVALPLRNETLVYPVAELEAIRVVEPNEPIARVQDRRTRTVVASQHDLATARVAPLELQNVADRGAAKLVYRLVVVADHDTFRCVAVSSSTSSD